MNTQWAALMALSLAAPAAAQDAIVIEGARVFDGTGKPARVADVLVVGGTISAVGPSVAAPADAVRVDGRGKTLIPGLHDLHTHARSPAYSAPEDLPEAWAAYLLSGVTSINDFSVSGEMIAPIRELTQPGQFWAPNLSLAVRFGVPGGHGTEAGWGPFFTLQTPTVRSAQAALPLAFSYDPDLLKVFTDGWRYDRDPDLNSMNLETLSAIVAEARKAGKPGKPVITHTVTLAGAKLVAAAGVDALGHGIGDALVDKELIALMRKNGTAYVSTLAVYEPSETRVLAPVEFGKLNAFERAREAGQARGAVEAYDAKRWDILRQNIRRLKKAGIPIGIGTDAGIGGTYHGTSAVRETVLLTKLGFSPAEALVAATRTSAEIMNRERVHGTIAPGKRADLVLIDGQPDKQIDDLWNVARVWVAGREAPLAELRTLRELPGATPLPSVAITGPVMTGKRSDGRTDLDTLPVESTDPGADHSDLVAHRERPDGPTFLAAQFGAAPKPYAQWVIPLTKGPIRLADARRFDGIELRAGGDGDFRLVLESYGLNNRDWFAAGFNANKQARTVRLPFSAFRSQTPGLALDLAQLRALRFEMSGSRGGSATLELGDVRFYRD